MSDLTPEQEGVLRKIVAWEAAGLAVYAREDEAGNTYLGTVPLGQPFPPGAKPVFVTPKAHRQQEAP